ncbi:MAG: Na+:solute symporter, partial [bacterium]
WYPGAEPGGGSYIAQRMLASKSEKDSLGGTLFFNLAHYVLRPWPWIITALCSIIIFPELKDIAVAFPLADPRLIGHDSAFPAMLKFLPAGFVGLMVGGLIAANSSTILTHLNWGSSYLVHDFYRRFINGSASERHYVNVGRVCTVGLYICAALLSLVLDSAQEAFEILISIGAGTGLLYLLRWYWWRINAICEVVAMASSFTISIVFFIMKKTGHALPFAQTILCSVAFTTACWMVTAFLSQPTSREQLIAFYRKVYPAGPGWARIREEAGVSLSDAALHGDHMGKATLGWISGCLTIWSSLFAIGNFLYGRTQMAVMLTAVFAVSGLTLLYVVNTLWDKDPLSS